MKRLLACLALCASLSASAQVVYPYNPDANGDSSITSGDLLDFLPVFATTFTPQGITIDGVPLDEWLEDLEAVVNSNAASIESLFAMQSQINALETANDNLQSQINSLQDQLNNLTFSVDGLPPCVDLDDDGICDFADHCPPVVVSFNHQDENYEVVTSELLIEGGLYYQADLNDLEAPNACLANAILDGAQFHYAILPGADFSGASLQNVSFFGANLTGADFSNSFPLGAGFSYADLSYANLHGLDFAGPQFVDADLTGADLSYADLSYGDLSYADLEGANLTGASMTCLSGCPSQLPPGYICESDPGCSGNRYRIVEE